MTLLIEYGTTAELLPSWSLPEQEGFGSWSESRGSSNDSAFPDVVKRDMSTKRCRGVLIKDSGTFAEARDELTHLFVGSYACEGPSPAQDLHRADATN